MAARTRASRDLATIPPGYPNEHRLGGASLFRAVLGGIPESTFARWLADGAIDAPVKLGGSNAWPEKYMAQVAAQGTRPRQAQAADPLN
jgi:hypothetical protein